MQRTRDRNDTLIDKRNGQKGMLGTRIIHVLCPLWKSLFAAMLRETVSKVAEGRAFLAKMVRVPLQGRRREGAMYGLALDYDGERF